ncbi:MAG: hypothetical protein U5L01_10470 [Rheinheimera sp.]|nr:hypothetical protein [Rheinheimera sp.]
MTFTLQQPRKNTSTDDETHLIYGAFMDKNLLADLIRFNGIETAFTDAWGNATTVAEPDQLKLLAALGFAIDDEATARANN